MRWVVRLMRSYVGGVGFTVVAKRGLVSVRTMRLFEKVAEMARRVRLVV